MALIYLIEDDPSIRKELARLLDLEGFSTLSCEDFAGAARSALAAQPDCILLDLSLPQADGHQICREVRTASQVPIIVLTSSADEFDEVMALGLGANDYVTKPYRPATLIARIKAQLRSSQTALPRALEYRGLVLDESTGTASYLGKHVQLTRNEQGILGQLMRHAGKTLSRQQLMVALWESDSFIDDNTLSVNVNRLRKELKDLGLPHDLISTKRGIGYMLGKEEL